MQWYNTVLWWSLSLPHLHSRGIGRQNHTRGLDILNMAAIGSGPISVLFPCISLKITGMLSKLKIRFPQVFMPTVKMNTAMTFMASPAEAWKNERVHEINIQIAGFHIDSFNIYLKSDFFLKMLSLYSNFKLLGHFQIFEFCRHFVCNITVLCWIS